MKKTHNKLPAGRTAQEYNLRKNRKGAFWEDRYHATAVEDDDLLRNNVRAERALLMQSLH